MEENKTCYNEYRISKAELLKQLGIKGNVHHITWLGEEQKLYITIKEEK